MHFWLRIKKIIVMFILNFQKICFYLIFPIKKVKLFHFFKYMLFLKLHNRYK